jgi:N-acetylglucosaminyl-diphospho-decaprenol L-rhamnosyltransferase
MNESTARDLLGPLTGISACFQTARSAAPRFRRRKTGRPALVGVTGELRVKPEGLTRTLSADQGARPTPVIVDAVIVAYNSRDTLRACVEPLASRPWVNVTVIDNASPDDSAAAVADLAVRTIRAPRNGGFAYGCNLGLAAGAAEFVLFLNPDARIEPASLQTLVRTLRADPLLGGVGPRTFGDDGRLHLTQRRFPRLCSTYCQAVGLHHLAPGASWAGEVISDPGAYTRPATPDWLSGACVLMRRRALEEAGGLDEGFFLYSEETDLFRRLQTRGWRARFEPQAIAYHQCYGSAPRDSTAPILARSRVRYARKHHGALVSLLEAVGVAIDAVIRAAAWAHRPARRRGHLASAWAALSAVRLSNAR